MKRGLTDIIDAKRGTTQINKIMRGTTLIWEKVVGFNDPVIIIPSGTNQIPAPDNVSHASWNREAVTVQQFAEYSEMTTIAASKAKGVHIQGAPNLTVICEFQDAGYGSIILAVGRGAEARYGGSYTFQNDTLTVPAGGVGITLQRERLPDGWVKLRVDSTSASGLHDNFVIQWVAADGPSEVGVKARFRNPKMFYN